MTSRIRSLIEQLNDISDDGVFYERAILLTEAEKLHRNDSNGNKYAACFAYLLDHMTVLIRPGELIVGSCKEEILDEAHEKLFDELCRRYNFKATELFTFDPLHLIEISDEDERFAPEWFNSYGHCIPDWERVLKLGFTGIRAEAETVLAQRGDTLTEKQIGFLKNAIQTAEAMNRFILRYADLAEKMVSETTDPSEKARLSRIGCNCQNLSICGASSFEEAIQLYWFGMFTLQVVCGARDYAFGRIDRVLLPYYQKDLNAGKITFESALELMENLFIKSNEIIGYAWEAYKPKRVLSKNSLQYILLSGSAPDGSDLTNDVSRLVLEAVYELKLKQPTVNICRHENIDRSFYERACEIAASGLGYPSFFNDQTVIPSLLYNDVPEKEAWNYGYYGCNNSFLPGKEDELREAWECGPKLLEYALNSGASMTDGRVQGCITPSANSIRNMDDLFEVLRAQFAFALAATKAHVERSDAYWNEMKPFSFESLLMSDCIQKASSMNDEGALQHHINCHFVGIATVANSLYAIDRLVFQEKKLTLPEFVELLKSDWAENEYLQIYIKERFPKYGNDEEEVDIFARRVSKIYLEEIEKATPAANGRKLYASFYSLWHHRAFGKVCAASADGRNKGDEISESQSPVYGTDASGPTAMFNTIAKLPFSQTPSGGINVKFQPRLFQGEKGYLTLLALLEGYFKNDGMHAQINVIAKETLEDAVQHPKKYRNLMVRVVGYSAYFVSLSPEQQQEMIDRTEL